MNSTTLKTNMDSLFADNAEGGITALDLRTITEELIARSGGTASYYNTALDQTITPSTWTKLSINKLGAGTDESALPFYITTPLITDSELDFSIIRENSAVHFRPIVKVVTTAINQVIHLRVRAFSSTDVELTTIHLGDFEFKAAGTYEIAQHTMLYGNPQIIAAGGYGQLEIYSLSGLDANFESAIIRIAG